MPQSHVIDPAQLRRIALDAARPAGERLVATRLVLALAGMLAAADVLAGLDDQADPGGTARLLATPAAGSA